MLDIYKRDGCCIVRGVFSAKDAATIRSSAGEVYQHIIGSKAPKVGANTLHLSDVAKQSPAWMADFVVWTVRRFIESDAMGLYRTLYGDEVVFPLLKCIVRFQRPDHTLSFLPFHQDADPANHGTHMVNCWTALDPCGVDAPTIEVVKASITGMRQDLFVYESLEKAGSVWREKLAAVQAEFGRFGTERPVFHPGDGCIFDHFALHRTYFTESMTKPRMSIEIRAANAAEYEKTFGKVDRIDHRGRLFLH